MYTSLVNIGMYITVLLGFLGLASGGRVCLDCKFVLRPDECSHITTCGEHEQCYINQYVTSSGFVLYDLGCKDDVVCTAQSISGPFGRKRMQVSRDSENEINFKVEDDTDGRTVTCEACCNNTDVCNNGGLCGTPGFDYKGGRLCYSCEQQFSPTDCDRVELCYSDRACYIHQKHADTSSFIFWSTGCAETTKNCSAIPGINRCTKCCKDNLCNNECHTATLPVSTQPPTTPTPTTVTTVPTTTKKPLTPAHIINVLKSHDSIRYGDTVRLMCIVEGNPTPTTTWTMQVAEGTTVTNVKAEAGGTVLVITNFNRANDVSYRCHTTNSQGNDSKILVLHGSP